jgi:hypothetical protein
VFASNRLVERVRVRALNEPEQWGPSDQQFEKNVAKAKAIKNLSC